ncbi:MAG: serine/threonine protein kinase [Planctomycetes bacterium]|nr:serine/threonine protein kinase [Planctomycetota bacterium]
MNTPNTCTNCGSPLGDDVRGGLCPACLLKCGMQTNTMGFSQEDPPGAPWTPPTVEELAPLFAELEILELIGRGGMGAVYKAREKDLDRLVALKILPPEIGRDPAFAQRFAREAQAMARLSHPNIVTIYSFGSVPLPQSQPLYYFIMEYVDGLSLRRLLDAKNCGSDEALAIVPQICDALQYAHDRGIVHRDIKPENILLSRDGQVKIADFGLAKLVGMAAAPDLSRPGEGKPDVTAAGGKVMGTPHYMAPEQLERPGDVDHRADIYSLGVVFYQMLTGELPTARIEPPSRKVLIDVRLDEVVLRALEAEPHRRYQHVSEVRTQVETIVTHPMEVRRHLPYGPWGWEYRSQRTLWGLPLVHCALGWDPATGRRRRARGIIAFGDRATGVVAIGGAATGVIAFGGFAAGVIALGGLSLGLIGMGGSAVALLFAWGGLAVAPVAFGGMAVGLYGQGGLVLSAARLPRVWGSYAAFVFYGLGSLLGLLSIYLSAVLHRRRPGATGYRGNGGAPNGRLLRWMGVCALAALAIWLLWAYRHFVATGGRRGAPLSPPAAARSASGTWTVTLSSGATVELLSVSAHPSADGPWWRPDGSPLGEWPYSPPNASAYPQDGQRAREVAVCLTDLPPGDIDTTWAFLPAVSRSGGSPRPQDDGSQLAVTAVIVPDAQAVITVRFGVAAGPWETLAETNGQGSSSFSSQTGSILVAPAVAKGEGAMLTVTHNVTNQATRVVAVTRDGREVATGPSTSAAGSTFAQHTFTFHNTPLEDILAFRFQVRPYEWAAFENVTLDPAGGSGLRSSPSEAPGPEAF